MSQVSPEQTEVSPMPRSIVLRQSILFLCLKILFIFIVFGLIRYVVDGIYLTVEDVDVYEEVQAAWSFPPMIFLFISCIEVCLILYCIVFWYSYKYTITPEAVDVSKGVFWRSKKTFAIRNIESVNLKQSLFGRIFGYGTVYMFAPTLQEKVFMRRIPKAKKYFYLIEELIPKTKPLSKNDQLSDNTYVLDQNGGGMQNGIG